MDVLENTDKIDISIKMEIELRGKTPVILAKAHLVTDALAGNLVEPPGTYVCDHTEEIEEITELREDLAAAVSEVERLRNDRAEVAAALSGLEQAAEDLRAGYADERADVGRIRAQHDTDLKLIEGLHEANRNAAAASAQWHDESIKLRAVTARLEADKADILRALATMARDGHVCMCDSHPPTCIGMYEGTAGLGCDHCCTHSMENGWCVQLPALEDNDSKDSTAPAQGGPSSPRSVPADAGAGDSVHEEQLSESEEEHGAGAGEVPAGAHPSVLRGGAPAGAAAAGGGAVRSAGDQDHGPAEEPGTDGGAAEAAGSEGRSGPGGDREVTEEQPSVGADTPAAGRAQLEHPARPAQADAEGPEVGAGGAERQLTPQKPAPAEDDEKRISLGIGELYLLVDDEVPLSRLGALFAGQGDLKPRTDHRAKVVHVMSPAARGEVRGYFLIDGGLHLRLPAYTGDWPEMDAATAGALGAHTIWHWQTDHDTKTNERKEPTDQAAPQGPVTPEVDSREPSAAEKAAETEEAEAPTQTPPEVPVAGEAGPAPQPEEWDGKSLPPAASAVEVLGRTARFIDVEGNDVQLIGDVGERSVRGMVAEARRMLAGEPRPRWGHTADPDPIFHLWPMINDATDEAAAEATCGEVTDADLTLLPEGAKPDPEQACMTCADLIGWDEPNERSRIPVEPQRELALREQLSDLAHRANVNGGFKLPNKCFCGDASFKGRQKKVILGARWHMRGECGEIALTAGEAQPGDSETCLAPGCPDRALGTRADAVCQVHREVTGSIRVEWYFQRYPDRKPKPRAPPAKKLVPKKEAARG